MAEAEEEMDGLVRCVFNLKRRGEEAEVDDDGLGRIIRVRSALDFFLFCFSGFPGPCSPGCDQGTPTLLICSLIRLLNRHLTIFTLIRVVFNNLPSDPHVINT
jgi:hypothetical protein